MSDKPKSNRLRATQASAQLRAFLRRVTMELVDRNRWQIDERRPLVPDERRADRAGRQVPPPGPLGGQQNIRRDRRTQLPERDRS